MNAIDGFVEQGSVDLQRKPGMITASEVIALRTSFAILAFGGAYQLLQFAVKFFDQTAHLVRVLSDLREHSLIRIIGDDLADQAGDVVGGVGAVGVVDDAAAGVGFDEVQVDDPFEGGAVAEAVVEGLGG